MRPAATAAACVLAAATFAPTAPFPPFAPTAASTPTAVSTQDRTYLTDSASGALWEVAGGRIAQTNSTRADVRAFGQRMVTDHSRQYADARRVAAQVGERAPTSPDPTQQHDLGLFRQARGTTFDCVYLSTEWTDHLADIASTQLELSAGKDARVRAYAARNLPVLRQHLALVERDLQSLPSCR
jgi:putative membrane protein